MSTLMKFNYLGNIYQFENGGSYPAGYRHEKLQVKDRVASGILQVEDLGITIQSRTIVFNLMSRNDYNALVNWFLNTVNGAAATFIFTDEYGVSKNVKIQNDILDFNEDAFNLFSGSITLEYV